MKRLVIVGFILLAGYRQVPAQKTGAVNVEGAVSQLVNQAGFVKNAGQFTDENNRPVQTILYGAQIGACGVFITGRGLSYINYKLKAGRQKSLAGTAGTDTATGDYVFDIERTDVTLEHAQILDANAETVYNQPDGVTYNYYTAANKTGTPGLHACKEIRFRNVYPFIDWCVQLSEDATGRQAVKYNFIIRPGGDARNIALQYSKNVQLQLNRQGDLLAHTPLADFTEKAPVSYIEHSKEPVQYSYKLTGQTVRFAGSPARNDQTVVLDPEVFWATYLPSVQPDLQYLYLVGADIATDDNSNIFVTLTAGGRIPFITVDPGNGAFYQDYTVTRHGAMIVLKFTPGGRLLWSTYFSGQGQTKGLLLTADQKGNIYATGKIVYDNIVDRTIRYTDIPLKNNGGYYDTIPKENFITKFDNDGKLLWCSFFGGYDTYPQDITTDNQGNLYVTGWADYPQFPVINPGNGAYMQGPQQAAQLVFINQFNADCKLLWSTHIDGNDYDPDARVEVDVKGNIYLAANIRSTKYPLKDAGGYFSPDLRGFVLVKFNKDRQLTWCTGVPGAFSLGDIATDEDCNLYVANARGNLRKFNEKTALVWTRTYTETIAYSYERMVYNKKNKVLHILGIMNDNTYDFPTKNTECKGSFFYNGRSGNYPNVTGPIFTTYTTEGDLQYCSLADWPTEYYYTSNFSVDANGDAVYLFRDNRHMIVNPSVTDPGDGAYYNTQLNKYGQTPFVIKLKNAELDVTAAVTPSAGCDSNNAVDLRVLCGKAPYKYAWSNGLASSNVRLPGGKYWVKVTDAGFLTKTLYFNFDNPPGTVQRFKAEVSGTYCDKKNGLIAVNDIQGGKSPFSFSLNGQTFTGNSTFANIDSGKYILTVRDADGCLAKDTVSVARIAGPSSLLSTVTPASCSREDGAMDVKVTGGTPPYQYAINNGALQTDHVFTRLAAAAVTISVKDSAGCIVTGSQVIPSSLPPDSAVVVLTPDHCFSSLGALDVTTIYGGAKPFEISLDGSLYSNQLRVSSVKAGVYSLYIKDNKNCVLPKTIRIENIAGPDKIYFHVLDAVCGSTTGEVRIDSVRSGSAPLLFSLNSGTYQGNPFFKGVATGTQLLEVRDKFGCTASQPLTINYRKQTGIRILPHDTLVCYQQQIPYVLYAEDPAAVASTRWSTGTQGTRTAITPLQNQPVSVAVTDQNGCIIRDTAFVQVKACNTAENCVAIPSAFTPNYDGINDAIGPLVNGCLIKNLHFRVYNRFGQMVFETREPYKKWNGRINGVEQPQGAYVFTCSFTTGDNVTKNTKGTLLLIR